MKLLVSILWLVVVVDAGKSQDASLSQRFNRGVENLYRKSEALQEKAYKRIYDLQERAEDIQTKALRKAEQLEKQAESLLDRATRQAQDLQRESATQLGELQAAIESLSIGSKQTESAEDTETIVGSLSQRFSGVVEELYQKAERLQDTAYKRVRELQEQAEEIQAVSLKKAEQLERQAESLLDRATREAQKLQREAAAQLGELQATIEGHSIPPPPPPPLEGTTQSSLPVIEDVTESFDDTTAQDISTHEQSGYAVEESVVETTAHDISTQSGYAPPMEGYTPPPEEYAPPPEETVQVAFIAPTSKWNNVRERTLPAVLMLGALTAFIRFCGDMIPLVFLIQVVLYAETTAVVNVTGWKKWWWFLTAIAATNGHFLQWNYSEAIAYGMAATGLVAWVIQQNLAGTVETFRSNLAKLAATHLSLVSFECPTEHVSLRFLSFLPTLCLSHVLVDFSGPVVVLDCHVSRLWLDLDIVSCLSRHD
jgi:uncharacterized protein YoxC